MELDRIKILVDKYFDGLTSLEDEQQLAQLLRKCDNLPEEYKAVMMMLSSFEELSKAQPSESPIVHIEKRSRKWLTINRHWITGAVAAACIIFGVTILIKSTNSSITTSDTEEPSYICYVNGTKVENDQMAYAEAARILGNVSEDVHIAMEEINRLTRYTIVK